MQSEQRSSTWTESSFCGSQRIGWRNRESQLGHVVSLATAANVPPAPDGNVSRRARARRSRGGFPRARSGQTGGMDARKVGMAVGATRVAFGAGMLLAPPAFARSWTGPGGARRPSRVLARALGAREVAIGAGGVLAARSGDPGDIRLWFGLGALPEAADVLFTLTDGPRTPSRIMGALMAAATAAGAAYVASAAR